jgi:hypothetical protein
MIYLTGKSKKISQFLREAGGDGGVGELLLLE